MIRYPIKQIQAQILSQCHICLDTLLYLPFRWDAVQKAYEIRSCQAAKRYFDSLSLKKLPSIHALKQGYATLASKNKRRYLEQKRAREEMIELLTAKNNVERILGVTEKEKHRNHWQGER